MTGDRACLLRMLAQGLDRPAAAAAAGAPADRLAAAARQCGGIQAQDLMATRLAANARVAGLRLPEVIAACDVGQAVVRSWFMRGTLHLVAAQDAPWMTALLGPVTIARYRGRRAQLGLDDALCTAAVHALAQVLSAGPLDRKAIMAGLRADGVPVPGGQAPAHLLIYAACQGVIARGPDQGAEPTYKLLPPAAPDPMGSDGPAALARRYFAAFAPASAADFSAWSGLPVRACGAAIKSLHSELAELAEVVVQGSRMWVPAAWLDSPVDHPPGLWQLLPAFDTYLVGYRHRDLLIDPAVAGLVYPGGGWIHPAVVRDGRVVGTWRLQRAGRAGRAGGAATADILLFDGSTPPAELATVVAGIGAFLGQPVGMRSVTALT
jgi:hypothetical protein